MYHLPVMLGPCLEALQIQPDGIYVDVTFGGGGHSKAILERLGPDGRLIGFDQDPDALSNALDDPRFLLIESNFRFLHKMLRMEGITEVDGILADLGVSSHQLDEVSRGFTHRTNTTLDMRMSQAGKKDAAYVLNHYTEEELVRVFSEYGEVRNSKTLAREIVDSRSQRSFDSTEQLILILERVAMGEKHKYLSTVFQALRIEVNEEMETLAELLEASLKVLKSQGRLVVLTYHSLEDRLVKNFMKTGQTDGTLIQDDFGRIERPFKVLTKKPILPDPSESKANPRSRSAKLRIAEKN
jgi:16S rRNA (cytosine1402-N4)-methyltransferase